MPKTELKGEAGFTFAELAFAMLVMVVSATVLINHLAVNFKTTSTERDRVFAFSKAQAILAEIQSFVDQGGVEAAVDLDILDDGITSKFPLTIQTDSGGSLVAADHAVSGNYQREGAWVWSRRITVQPFTGLNNRNVRYVTVRIFKIDDDGNEAAMADLSAVINSAGSAYPTTQVFDIYLFAIENIPGWWVFMDSIKPFVESMITDLENRNPGMKFRTHWITKAAFGRNHAYCPLVNDAVDSESPIGDVYFYPARMPTGNASTYYYVPDNMTGRISLDGVETNGYDATYNPLPYALADFYNHAMRQPEEQALWQARIDAIEQREADIAAALAGGMAAPEELDDMSKEPTLRLFLDDLVGDPDKYKNALIINLHGELLPMPALRNFSDAAREPVNHPNWRVVTHPEQQRTINDGASTEHLRFRIYSYVDNKHAYTGVSAMDEPIVLEFEGLNLTDNNLPPRLHSNVTLQHFEGGGLVDYSFDPSTPNVNDSGISVATDMCYEVETYLIGSVVNTRLYLYNSPLNCDADSGGRGLWNVSAAEEQRSHLYGMAYVPCPVESALDFSTNLMSAGAGPKNTARWILDLDPAVLTDSMFHDGSGYYDPPGDITLQVKTRIASNYLASGRTDLTWQGSGQTFPATVQPDNLSRAYAWWTDSADDVPMSERAQFNGDPRHVPYADCFDGGDDFPNSYNWYHDSLNNHSQAAHADFGSINGTYLRNRWGGSMWCDVPRYFEWIREGLVESACVYTSLTGFSYYYLGIGNEIGYDAANGYPNSIPVDQTPYAGSGAGYINNITGTRKLALVYKPSYSPNPTYWAGFPWLGELYPDELASDFLDTSGGAPRGNLDAGFAADTQAFRYQTYIAYVNTPRQAYGTGLYDNHQRTSVNGCSTFFNIGTSSTRFRHVSTSGNGTLTTTGDEVASMYNMTMPTAAPVSRPFQMNYGGSGGDHWNYPPYSTRFTGSLFTEYYTHSSGVGSGLIKLENPAGTSAGYIVVNGIDKAVQSGTSFIAKWAVLSLTHSFFEAGDSGNTLRIPPLARVELKSPTDITELNDPTSIDVLYGIEWTRWDGEPYTQTGSWSENENTLEYVIVYSIDNGTTWKYAQTDLDAELGTPPTNPLNVETDSGVGDETYTWDVSSGFPEGSYLLRVECYRQGAQVHYSWHQNKIYIQR